MSALRTLYSPIEPYETGMLDIDDGHTIYYGRVGTPGVEPAMFLHDGPGSGISADRRRVFDPARYGMILLGQRGCGWSALHGGLEASTTWHLVTDIKRLHAIAGIDRRLVFGGPWDSALVFTYAQKYPQHVSKLVLRGTYTVTRVELRWYYQCGVSEMLLEKQARFQAPIPEAERGDIIATYRKALTGDGAARQIKATRARSVWEGETTALLLDPTNSARHVDDRLALASARLENRHFTYQCWLKEGQLLREARRLADIPDVIVHGRYDMPCPAHYAYALYQMWSDSDFHLVEGAGRAWSEPGILD